MTDLEYVELAVRRASASLSKSRSTQNLSLALEVLANELVLIIGERNERNSSSNAQKMEVWPLPSFDARDWAKAFCKLNPSIDEELMVTWFANALMRGYDEDRRQEAAAGQVNG